MEKLQWNSGGGKEPETDSNGTVIVNARGKSDFWRTPNRSVMDGHFGSQKVSGDFSVTTKFSGGYTSQYDQAGIMIKIHDQHWLKAGIELINGIIYVSAVVTNPYSDWSVVPFPIMVNHPLDCLNLRIEKQGVKVIIDYYFDSQNVSSISNETSGDGDHLWTMLRKITNFFDISEHTEFELGLMAASPQSASGFEAKFYSFELSQ